MCIYCVINLLYYLFTYLLKEYLLHCNCNEIQILINLKPNELSAIHAIHILYNQSNEILMCNLQFSSFPLKQKTISYLSLALILGY